MRGFRVLMVAAVVGVTVAAGVSPAAALDPIAPPLALPSSVVGSLDSATAAQRAAALGNVVKGGELAVPASTWGSVAKGGPAVMVGVTGFFIGFEGASAVLGWAGVDDVGLKALFPTAVDPGFIPNADVVLVEPGWVGGNSTFNSCWVASWVCGTATAVRVTIASSPAYGVAGTVVVRVIPLSSAPSGYNKVLVNGDAGSGMMAISSGYYEASIPRYGGDVWPLKFSDTAAHVTSGTNRVSWYPVGHPQRPADPVVDPVRAWETRWTCSDSSSFVTRSAQFHETDATLPAVPSATCAIGSPISVEVWEVAPLGGATEVLIESWTPTQALIDWQRDFPQCTDGSCTLELFRLDPTAPTTRLSCFANPNACLDWYTDPSKAEKYECRYAGEVVALDECAAYAPTFNVATGTDVQTATGPKPAPEIAPYADPATGEPVPGSNPQPLPNPAGQPSAQPEGCPPPFDVSIGGFGHWVYKGVACALAWAFVPSPETLIAGRDSLDQALSESAMGDVRALFVSLGAVEFSGNCGVIYSNEIEAFGGRVMELDTCGEPWTSASPLRALAGLAFIIGTTVAVVKMVSRALGLRSLGVAAAKSVASDGD